MEISSIWRINIPEFALFTIASFLEGAKFGIERHETYDPRVSAVRTESRGILLEIPDLLRACFSAGHFCRILHARGADVERSVHAFLHSYKIDWHAVGRGEELVRTGPYLYYDWDSGTIVNMGAGVATLPLFDNENRPIRGHHRNVELLAMEPVWCDPEKGQFTRADVMDVMNEQFRSENVEPEEFVAEPSVPFVKYEDEWEEDEEDDDDDCYHDLGQAFADFCPRFELMCPLPTRGDDLVGLLVRYQGQAEMSDRLAATLRTMAATVQRECDELRNELGEVRGQLTEALTEFGAARACEAAVVADRDRVRTELAQVRGCLTRFREWIWTGMPAL